MGTKKKLWFSTTEVDEALDYAPGVAVQMIHKGYMDARKVGGMWIISRKEVEKHLERRISLGRMKPKELTTKYGG